jgi:hypothetical protein
MNEQPKLTKQQKVETLRNIFMFLSNFDRVPGALAKNWADMLQSLAVIADNIALEEEPKKE